MHAIEKILAAKAGVPQVTTGEIVNCTVDVAGINDVYLQTVRSFYEMGAKKVFDPDKLVFFFDHYAPCATTLQANNHRAFREFCQEQGIKNLMEVNEGVCHQVLADKGWSCPGEIIVVTDSHTPTHGAFGAFSTGVGATDLATIMITGKLWFMVPEIIRINLTGKLPKGVYAKDVILHIIGDLGADYAVYKAVEFAGPVIKELSVSQRMCLCNMTTEMGAKACYIQPDEITKTFLKEHAVKHYDVYHTDANFKYAADLTYDVSGLEPQVAIPSSVDNVGVLKDYENVKIDQAYLGSCTGGRTEDIAIAAQILQSKHIHKAVRLIVAPASKAVLEESMAKGYIKTLLDAGATLISTGCGACCGIHQGMLGDNETCISSTNRNFPGRMGSTKGKIYLASPATVAMSALTGRITSPVTEI
ncbi:MAG: 3-isopropylmalate dehydratase large subunit [Acidaminococcaceae bacterium]|jgi:3-isopropylmalate/(R)-2-methylmalate dehydratase large subunit|nr:3-isopropylmalate dehydratase large subunit [Acidaminococcaceae bacterium]MCI2110375.1 3-isopropylmalate dehydratase large subunit [Acidaminococcaceae bacterium]